MPMTKITLTAKIKLLPDPQEQELLRATMQAYLAACNFVSAYIFRTHDLTITTLNQALYREIRSKFGLRSQMAQSVIRTVIARYKTILTNQEEWIQPKFKKPECDQVWNRDYSLKPERFAVNTLTGRLKLPFKHNAMEHYFGNGWEFGTAKLVTKKGKWYFHISVSKDVETPSDSDIRQVVGVDLGLNFTFTAYDSEGKTIFQPGREVKHRRAKFAKTRKELQKRGTPSARHRLKQIGSRESGWMQDVNHRVSKALVESYPPGTLFVLEDLTGIRSATERVRLPQRYVMVSWAFFDLRKKVEYKALGNGSKVILVDPKYTSQTCPTCGHQEKSNRSKKTHTFCCKKCGYASNDDRIGAMNLHNKGIGYLGAVADR